MDTTALQALLTDHLARIVTIVDAEKLTPPFEVFAVQTGEGRHYLVITGQEGVRVSEGERLLNVIWNVVPVFLSTAP